jgi:hypothetical protein
MPLPTETISLGDVNVELGRSATAEISMNDAALRGLAGVASGSVGMSSLRGKANTFAHTISSNQQELNLYTYLVGQGWNTTSAVQLAIANGVYIWSDNTSVAALNTGGLYPGGLTIVNNGFIIGKGGAGGGINTENGSAYLPSAGGPAITLTAAVSIDNTNGYIGGGGGGGAAGAFSGGGGGGAGGGLGGITVRNDFLVTGVALAAGTFAAASATLPAPGGTNPAQVVITNGTVPATTTYRLAEGTGAGGAAGAHNGSIAYF